MSLCHYYPFTRIEWGRFVKQCFCNFKVTINFQVTVLTGRAELGLEAVSILPVIHLRQSRTKFSMFNRRRQKKDEEKNWSVWFCCCFPAREEESRYPSSSKQFSSSSVSYFHLAQYFQKFLQYQFLSFKKYERLNQLSIFRGTHSSRKGSWM